MSERLRKRLRNSCRAFASPDNTLFAQILIAFLLLCIQTVVAGDIFQKIDCVSTCSSSIDPDDP